MLYCYVYGLSVQQFVAKKRLMFTSTEIDVSWRWLPRVRWASGATRAASKTTLHIRLRKSMIHCCWGHKIYYMNPLLCFTITSMVYLYRDFRFQQEMKQFLHGDRYFEAVVAKMVVGLWGYPRSKYRAHSPQTLRNTNFTVYLSSSTLQNTTLMVHLSSDFRFQQAINLNLYEDRCLGAVVAKMVLGLWGYLRSKHRPYPQTYLTQCVY